MISQQNYPGYLLYYVPEFIDTYNQYISDMRGELVGHPLFAELYDFTIAELEKGNLPVVDRIIIFINLAAQSSEEDIQNMVHTSFIEYLAEYDDYTPIEERLNPAAKAMLDAVVNWEPSVA